MSFRIALLLSVVGLYLPGALSQLSSTARVHVNPAQSVKNEQEYVTFRCNVQGVRSVRQVTWQRLPQNSLPAGRNFIYPSTPSNTSYLLLYNLQQWDSGIYRCIVITANGVALQADADLRVNGDEPLRRYCDPNPCDNEGTCVEGSNDYTCSCPIPYTGRQCETVDPCLFQPCQNGGTCSTTQRGDNFVTVCSCKSGFRGTTCGEREEVVTDICQDLQPCQNGGTCLSVLEINSFICLCEDSYIGGRCENRRALPEAIDNCLSQPCQNDGQCSSDRNGYSCVCTDGFTGEQCEQSTACSSTPCQHTATCLEEVNGYRCICTQEFMGQNCQTYNWCFNSPCNNGAVCRNEEAMRSFACDCASGYTGKTCNQRDYCSSFPCFNGGVCENTNTSYRCSCPDGFLGERCERSPQPGECAKYGQKMEAGELRDFFYTEILRTTRPAADIIFVVDESKSMVTEHAWLTEVSNALDSSLKEQGIGREVSNRFGLVGFAKDSPMDQKGRIIRMDNGRKFGTAASFKAATRRLALNGRLEDMYLGIALALDNYELRPGMACQIIGVTDEGRTPLLPSSRHRKQSNQPYGYDYIYELMMNKSCVLNVVVNQQMSTPKSSALGIGSQGEGYVESSQGDFTVQRGGEANKISGHGSTHEHYTRLALATRGGAWDLNKLRTGGNVAMAFTKAFVHLKQREISRQLCERCTCDHGPQASCREGCLGEPPTGVVVSSKYDRLSLAAVNEGDSATFACEAAGDPAPRCEWTFPDGRPLPGNVEYFGEGGCFVRVPSVSSSTCVKCVASNLEGTAQSSVQCVDYVASCQLHNGRKIFHGSSARNYTEVKREELPQIPFSSAVVVLIVDESGSMVGEHRWLKTTLPALENNLVKRFVGTSGQANQYALVGFASPRTQLGHIIPLGDQQRDCGDAFEVSAALDSLRQDGRKEDGYSAIGKALSQISCVQNRRRNITALQVILVTDEDRDRMDRRWNYESIRQEIVRHGGILNVVVQNQFHGKDLNMHEVRALGVDRSQRAVVPNSRKNGYFFLNHGTPTKDTSHGTTEQDYVDLAFATGGGAWDLGMLRDGSYRESFTLGFIAAKVEEIQVQILSRCHECRCTNGTTECRHLPSINTEQACMNPVENSNIGVQVLGEASASAGSFMRLDCVIEKRQPKKRSGTAGAVAVTWINHPLHAIQVESALEWSSVTEEDAGDWTCEARDEDGQAQGHTTLHVSSGPAIGQSSGLQEYTVDQGEEPVAAGVACIRGPAEWRESKELRYLNWEDIDQFNENKLRVGCCGKDDNDQLSAVEFTNQGSDKAPPSSHDEDVAVHALGISKPPEGGRRKNKYSIKCHAQLKPIRVYASRTHVRMRGAKWCECQ